MKVRELIEKLREFDPELIVAIADWSEECTAPSDNAASEINVQRVIAWNEEMMTRDLVTRLVIGDRENYSWSEKDFLKHFPKGRILINA